MTKISEDQARFLDITRTKRIGMRDVIIET